VNVHLKASRAELHKFNAWIKGCWCASKDQDEKILSYLPWSKAAEEGHTGAGLEFKGRQHSLIITKTAIMPRVSRKSQNPPYSQIKAQAVLEALKSGRAMELKEVELDGDLSIIDFAFNEYVQFSNCDFQGLVLARCRFAKGFAFTGCAFQGEVSFEGARAEGDCHFRACVFEKESRFDRLQVNGKLEVRAPRNKSPLKGNRYYTLDAQQNPEYIPYVIFEQHANFSQIRITGEANFGSVQFRDGADFYNARVDGPAFFRRDHCKEKNSATLFARSLFEKSYFGGKRVRFRDAYFGGELNFHGAVFDCEADFTYVHCQGIVFFCNELAPERTTDKCDFKQGVDFEGGRFATSLRLDAAIFSRDHYVQLRDCRIAETLAFTVIPKHLSLTGCSYKRVQCSHSDDLITALKLNEKSKGTFDKSSWIQLEATLRNAGAIKVADQVYRVRMTQERELALPPYRRPFNRMWGLFAGYGTEPWKLALVCCFVVLLGVIAFHSGPLKRVIKENQTQSATSLPDSVSCDSGSWGIAAETSVSQFSPLKLPIGEECAPSGWDKWVAVLLRITGLILVPLLVANLAGLLHRKAKSAGEGGGGED
jgi:uncharacterized protein YjbI with pentapeptide repeats